MDTQSNFETKNKKDEGNELQVIYFKKNLQKEKYSSPNYSFEAKKKMKIEVRYMKTRMKSISKK
jgi:hypothetical protein